MIGPEHVSRMFWLPFWIGGGGSGHESFVYCLWLEAAYISVNGVGGTSRSHKASCACKCIGGGGGGGVIKHGGPIQRKLLT